MGRGKFAAHMRLDAEKEHWILMVMHDYGFLGRDDEQVMPMLVSKYSRTFLLCGDIVPPKGDES